MKNFAILVAVCLFLQGAVGEVDDNDKGIGSGEAAASQESQSTGGLQLAHEIVNEQSDQPTSGEQFVAFHRDGVVGNREELSPTLLGVNSMAMKFLPANLRLLTVISVHRQIVAGVKYELLVNAVQEDTERTVCHLIVLEKPWIVNQWGEKWRNLLHTNCTGDGVHVEQPPQGPPEMFHVNPVFNREPVSLTADRVRDLENQILRGNPKRVENPVANTVPIEPLQPPQSPTQLNNDDGLTSGVREELDKFFNTQQLAVQQQQVSANEAAAVVVATSEEPLTSTDDPMHRLHYSTSINGNAPPEEADKDRQPEIVVATNDELDNGQQRVVPVFENVPQFTKNNEDDENNQKATATVIEAARRRRRRRSNDLNSKAGFVENARILGDDNDDGGAQEMEEVARDCSEKPFQFRKAGCPVAERVTREVGLPGGLSDMEDMEEAAEIVKVAMAKLAASSDKAQNLQVVKIERAQQQVVAGVLYHFEVVLREGEDGKPKKCKLKVWYQKWVSEEPVEVDGECEGKETYHHQRVKRSLIYDHRRPLPDTVRSSRDGEAARNEEELHQHLFVKFQTKFQRNYRTEREKTMRYKVFKTNLGTIEQLNRHEMGTAKYGLTEFSDMTAAEFKKYTGLLNAHHNPRLQANHLGNPMAVVPDVQVPKAFDWRERNVISPVKNQGQCGSCWAFSVVGNIEGLNAIKTGKLNEFSEQELVDCDTLDAGCNGGLPDNAYKAIEQIGGLEYENEYPYEGKQEQCHFNRTLSHVRVKGAVDLPKDEQQMAQWLVTNGPISIGLNAAAMQFYHGGVSHPYKFLCRAGKIDHGVLIVGLGVSEYPTMNKTLPYWIVKNSWGPTWGERGYYRIYRGDNTCGINSMASSAVLE